jgi:hypothetical protein
MRKSIDISVESPDGATIALVEVRATRDLSEQQAVAIKHEFDSMIARVQPQFFFVASQSHGYLWNLHAGTMAKLPLDEVVRWFVPTLRDGQYLDPHDLEFLIHSWIWAIANVVDPIGLQSLPAQFVEAVAGATTQRNIAA